MNSSCDCSLLQCCHQVQVRKYFSASLVRGCSGRRHGSQEVANDHQQTINLNFIQFAVQKMGLLFDLLIT